MGAVYTGQSGGEVVQLSIVTFEYWVS